MASTTLHQDETYYVRADTDIVDFVNYRLLQVSALVFQTFGGSGPSCRESAHESQDNFMWGVHDLLGEIFDAYDQVQEQIRGLRANSHAQTGTGEAGPSRSAGVDESAPSKTGKAEELLYSAKGMCETLVHAIDADADSLDLKNATWGVGHLIEAALIASGCGETECVS